jgi:hypothetical protein
VGEWRGWSYADVWFQEGLKRSTDSEACSLPLGATHLLTLDEGVAVRDPGCTRGHECCKDDKSYAARIGQAKRLNREQSSESRGRQGQEELHRQ